jgi:hypothetical protein
VWKNEMREKGETHTQKTPSGEFRDEEWMKRAEISKNLIMLLFA